ncbi:50S ribosomal protein L21 [Microvirga sp. W0021]|uniref:Large ribosomal subunit protein bL21 n=1 Tax=Hohaiivirga grylli TaxID=3133970 RepID=A0ABV0BEQ0_9HYPH
MFAVIKTGGKQYRVAAEDVIAVAKINSEAGSAVVFDTVTMFSNGTSVQIGAPAIAGLTVSGEVVEHKRSPKVIAFKKRRRQNSKRKRGHRQDYTLVRITALGDAKPAKKAAAKAEAAPAADAAPAKKAAAKKPAAAKAEK